MGERVRSAEGGPLLFPRSTTTGFSHIDDAEDAVPDTSSGSVLHVAVVDIANQ